MRGFLWGIMLGSCLTGWQALADDLKMRITAGEYRFTVPVVQPVMAACYVQNAKTGEWELIKK